MQSIRSGIQLLFLIGSLSLVSAAELWGKEKITIVGSGLSGLTTAYNIVKESGDNVEIDIYEGLERVGGRTYTLRLDEGYVEAGASFINHEHTEMLGMAHALGLEITKLPGKKKRQFSYVVDNQMYSEQEVFKRLEPFFQNIELDREAINKDAFFHHRLEKMSVDQYLREILIPRTNQSAFDQKLLYKIVSSIMADEVGAPIEKLHVLHLFDQLEIDLIKKRFDPFGDSDEALKISGGNQLVSIKLQEYLEQRGVRFHFKHTLEKIDVGMDGKVKLVINGETLAPDYAVITAPTHAILNHMEISPNASSVVQRRQNLRPLGFNTKYIVNVKSEFWKNYNFPTRFMGTFYQMWNSSEGGANTFTIYLNSNALKLMKEQNLTLDDLANKAVDEVGQFMPDFRNEIISISETINWKNNPFFGGSYSGARMRGGFYEDNSSINNRVGRLFFAGEQWTNIFPGFMEGSVRSGQAVSSWIQSLLRPSGTCHEMARRFFHQAI